jgi:cell division protein FtsB
MLYKIKTYITEMIIPSLKDKQVISLFGLGILAVLTSYSGVQLIEINYRLQQDISSLEARNRITKLENDNLRLKSEYLKTDTYLELVARQQFSKAAPGEKLILIPKDVALARAPKLEKDSDHQASEGVDSSGYLHNFQAWRDFYFPN